MSNTYLALLRGINVGGKNKIPMRELRLCLEKLGCMNVRSYIASGNVIFESNETPAEIAKMIEQTLPEKFKLDSDIIKILVLTRTQLKSVIDHAPLGFGKEPTKYHSDVIFMMDITPDEALRIFNPREGVDTIWRGDLAIYSQRLSEQRTKSRLSKITASPLYKSMTIRNWNTAIKLLNLMSNESPEIS